VADLFLLGNDLVECDCAAETPRMVPRNGPLVGMNLCRTAGLCAI
jgi:hypothetical protein